MDKYVKMSAIEKMAKPMDAFHGKMKEEENGHEGCKCPCCGSPCAECNEGMHESEEEYSEEE